MTGKEYMDEIKFRLFRIGILDELGDPLLMTYINQGRREVERITMNLFPERWSKIATITLDDLPDYPTKLYAALPDDFISAYVVILSWTDPETDEVLRREARQMAKREVLSIDYHSWNVPTMHSPAYNIERSGASAWYVYASLGDLTTSDLGQIDAEIWYTAAIDDLENINNSGATPTSDDDITMPLHFEELAILYAMNYCLQNLEENIAVQGNLLDIQAATEVIMKGYVEKRERETILLPSKEGVDNI